MSRCPLCRRRKVALGLDPCPVCLGSGNVDNEIAERCETIVEVMAEDCRGRLEEVRVMMDRTIGRLLAELPRRRP